MTMRLTVLGSGDAFGSGGRLNTCFMVESGGQTILLDCGATALPAMAMHGVSASTIDAVVLSHLHGDHFGGLPFFLLQGQFAARGERPLVIAGPPGTQTRLQQAMEVFFPKSSAIPWRFEWRVQEIDVGKPAKVLHFDIVTAEVVHQSGAPSTALRISEGDTVLAYSGDTEWTEALLPIARDADLFIVECYEYDRRVTGHMTFTVLRERLGDLKARRVMLTHMNPRMLAQTEEARKAGLLVAEDGLRLELPIATL